MKPKQTLPAFLLFVLFCNVSTAQDTLIINNNFRYKIGGKFIAERSGDYSLTADDFTVYSGGVQAIRKFGNTKSSIETGVYMITKAIGTAGYQRTNYYTVSIPVNYRIDTKIIYIAGGFYVDYLVKKQIDYDIWLNNQGNDRKLNLGFNLVVGIEKEINKELSLLVEARTFNNLTSSRTGGGDYLLPGFSNNGFAIGLNYKLLR